MKSTFRKKHNLNNFADNEKAISLLAATNSVDSSSTEYSSVAGTDIRVISIRLTKQ